MRCCGIKLGDIRKLASNFTYTESETNQEQVRAYLRSMGYDPDAFYQELEMNSDLVDAHRDTSYSNAQLQLHSHSFYELLYCRNTCGAEYLVGTERYRLQRGDVIFVPPGVSHRPLLPADMREPYKRYVMWFSTEFMAYLANLLQASPEQPPGSMLLRTAGTKWEYLGDYFRQNVLEAEKQAPGWEAVLTGNAICLLTQLHRAFQDRKAAVPTAEKPELLDQLLTYIEQHMAEKITLQQTARQFFVSQSTVSQLFRQRIGVSFYHFVTQRRLITAKEQIIEGWLLEDVAVRVGFADYSAFYRAFKQEYGISPRQFRNLSVDGGSKRTRTG